MSVTKQDYPDWESQIRHDMNMSEHDANDLVRSFKNIIETFDPEGPIAVAEVAVAEDDLHRFLPAISGFLQNEEHDEQAVRDVLWFLGMSMCQRYMSEEAINFHPNCTPAVVFFFGAMDDDDTPPWW